MCVAVLAAHQFGGAQEHGCPVPPGRPRPVGAGREGGGDRGVDLAGVGGGVAAEHVGVVVRGDDVDGLPEWQALAVDHVRELSDLAADAVELGVQGDGLGRAGAVVADGLVDGRGDAEVAGDGSAGLTHGVHDFLVGRSGGGAQPLTRERRNNRRFAGRSAMRRIRYGYHWVP